MQTSSRAPDLVAHNGKIITVDGGFSISDAVAVRGERIAAVGNGTELLAAADGETTVIDLAGRAVIPGLIDGHSHMDREGLKQHYPSLGGARSIDDILEIIAGLVAAATPGEWINTMPLGDPPDYPDMPVLLAEGRFPTRHDLDKVSPDNPVYLRPIWGYWRHDTAEPLVSVANSRALEIAGVTRDTPSPVDSVVIDKDPTSGEPTGIFIEHTLGSVVEFTLMRAAGGFSHADRVRGLERSMRAYLSFGTTTVFDGHGTAAEVLEAYKDLSARGEMKVRAELSMSPSWDTVAVDASGGFFDTWGRWLAGRGLGDSYLRVSGLYLQNTADSGLGSAAETELRTPLRPFTGWSGYNYDHALSPDKLVQAMAEAARRDIRVVTITPPMLEFLEKADRIEPIAGKGWVIGHIGVASEGDVRRIRELGLMVTTHTNRNIHRMGSALRDRLGAERENDISPLKRLQDAGVPFALGTDNHPISMFQPIWQAIARRDRTTGEVVAPGQKLSRAEALRAATMGGATICRDEENRGSLETGKLADFAVLDGDPLTIEEDKIRDIQADLTVVGGRIVYDRTAQD